MESGPNPEHGSGLSGMPTPLDRRAFLAAAAVVLAPRSPAPRRAPEVHVQREATRSDPWIEVDAAALALNIATVARLSGSRPILAVVKNNAYGLGISTIAARLDANSAIGGFAVVRTDEAIALRDSGARKPILLMARAADADVRELATRGVELAIWAEDDVKRLEALSRDAPLPVQFYIDSGMGRMGLPDYRALPLLRAAAASRALTVTGTFTEFAESAEYDQEQLRRFHALIAAATNERIRLGRLHAASSNGVYHLPAAHFDAVRPGIALYGAYPSRPDEERAKAVLQPAVRLRARVVRVERLRPGDGVSYGRNYVADRHVWTATLPVGHSDGYPREAVKGGRVLINGRLFPVIGAVSASHCIVEIGDEPAAAIGDVATFLGPDDPAIQPNTLAGAVGVSVYDLLMHLSPSLPRVIV